MNRSKTEAASVMTGKSLGIPMPPLIILIIEIPTAMTRKTTANPIDNADVYLNESATTTENADVNLKMQVSQKTCTQILKGKDFGCATKHLKPRNKNINQKYSNPNINNYKYNFHCSNSSKPKHV